MSSLAGAGGGSFDLSGVNAVADEALGAFGEAGEEGFAIVDEFERDAQIYLDQALRAAIPYTEFFTEKAINNMNRMFDIARVDTEKYWEMSQAQTSPYREAGYQALDMLQDTLGIARPSSGSSAMFHAMENQAKERAARKRMMAESAATAKELNMNPQDAFKFTQSATYGSNYPGLMMGLNEWDVNTLQNPRSLLGATDTRLLGKDGEPGETLPNNYNDVLAASQARFSPSDAISGFAGRALPINADLMRAINSQSSSQRALGNLGANTGYSHLRPVRRDVNA